MSTVALELEAGTFWSIGTLVFPIFKRAYSNLSFWMLKGGKSGSEFLSGKLGLVYSRENSMVVGAASSQFADRGEQNLV